MAPRFLKSLGSFFLYIYSVDQKLPKSEKLKSSKTIASLFSEGKSFSKYPLKVFFLPKENIETNLAAFAVPKRSFKSAVDRNRIKRQLRETYRLNKNIIEDVNGKKFAMLFLFLGKAKPRFAELETAMVKLFKKLHDENN